MPLRREGCWRSLVRCVNISMYICWRKEIAKMKLLNRRISFVPRNCKRTKSWLWGLNPHLAFSFGWKHINQKSLFAPIDWTWAHKSALATSFPRDLNMWAKFDFLTYKSLMPSSFKISHIVAYIGSQPHRTKARCLALSLFSFLRLTRSCPRFIETSTVKWW